MNRKFHIPMKPVSKAEIANEWANKILQSRIPFGAGEGDMPDQIDRHRQLQIQLIEEQAPIAAAVWARRRGDDPAQVTAADVAQIAHQMALSIAAAACLQAELDAEIADRLSGVSE